MLQKLKYIFKRKDRLKILALLLTVIVGSFLELMGVAIFSPFVNILMNPESIQEIGYLKWIYETLKFSSLNYFLASLTGMIIFIYLKIYFWHYRKTGFINFHIVYN